MDKPGQSAIEHSSLLNKLRNKFQEDRVSAAPAQLEAAIQGLDQKIQSSSSEIERFRTAREKATTAVAVTTQQLNQALDGIPETLRDAVAVQQTIAENERQRTARQNALVQAETADRKLGEAAAISQKGYRSEKSDPW